MTNRQKTLALLSEYQWTLLDDPDCISARKEGRRIFVYFIGDRIDEVVTRVRLGEDRFLACDLHAIREFLRSA